MKSTSAKLVGINADLADVKADVKLMTGKVNAIKKVYDSQVAQLADLDAQLAEIQAEQDAKSAQLTQRKTILAEHLRAAYDSDRTSMLETILSADSFSDAIADVGYLIDLGDQDRALAAQIAKDQETLVRAPADGQPDPLRHRPAAGRDGRPEEGPRLEPDRPQEGEGAAQEARGRDRPPARPPAEGLPGPRPERRCGEAHPGRRGARERRDRPEDPPADEPPVRWRRDPVGVQRHARLAAGRDRDPGVRLHRLRLGAAARELRPLPHRASTSPIRWGRAIHAAGPGKVIYAGPLSDGAWVVIIAHSQHLLSLYGHVKTNIPVRAGQTVRKGQVIAYVGMTGHTTGPHLHWSVQLNKVWVNPRLFL